jgi:hypothetical protein
VPREPDRLPDWFLGGAGKRRLLAAVLRGGPDRAWTEQELAVAAGLTPKNTIRRHIAVLAQAGVLRGAPGDYHVDFSSALVRALRPMLDELERLPDDPLPRSRGGAQT